MAARRKKAPKKVYSNAQAYYSNGGAAYQIEHAYEETEGQPIVKRKKKKIKPSPTKQLALESRANRAYSIKIILVLSVFFCGAVAFMWSSALVAKQRVATQNYRQELADLKNENLLLQADISEQMDLEVVKQIATEKLGMVEPQPYQIKYIDVPEQSYTVHYNEDNAQQEQNNGESTLVRTIVGLFKKE